MSIRSFVAHVAAEFFTRRTSTDVYTTADGGTVQYKRQIALRFPHAGKGLLELASWATDECKGILSTEYTPDGKGVRINVTTTDGESALRLLPGQLFDQPSVSDLSKEFILLDEWYQTIVVINDTRQNEQLVRWINLFRLGEESFTTL